MDKYNHPILKGIKGKRIAFRDVVEGKDLCEIHIVEKYITKKESKCSCACSI
jgi:hypothetical protein